MKLPRLRLLHRILCTTRMYGILGGFLLYFSITAVIIWLSDPEVQTLGDGFWYCFVCCTTIGFGDIVPSTLLSRILTVLLTVYGILIVAVIPGVIVSYVTEFNQLKLKESTAIFLDKLEHLEDLSTEELREISQTIRKKRNHL